MRVRGEGRAITCSPCVLFLKHQMRRSTAQVALRHDWLKITDKDQDDVRCLPLRLSCCWDAGTLGMSCCARLPTLATPPSPSPTPQLYKRLARVSSGTRESRPDKGGPAASGQKERGKGRKPASSAASSAEGVTKGVAKMNLETAML